MSRTQAIAIISTLIVVIIGVAAFLVIREGVFDNVDEIKYRPLTEQEQIEVLERLAATSSESVAKQEVILESLQATTSGEMSAEEEAETIRILESLQAPR